MMKKLYSLLSILLLVASCSTEEIEQIQNQSTDESTVSLSFSVDAPNALEITKAIGDVDKKGFTSLYLYTFDASGHFISPVVKAATSGDECTALISKDTRTIHFVTDEGDLMPATPVDENKMASLTTDKQIFWGKRTFNAIPAKDLSNSNEASGSNVELLRNWAKITLNLSTEAAAKLKDVSFLIYNESLNATVGSGANGSLNVASPLETYAPTNVPEDGKFAKKGESVYTFEHSNQDRKGAFVIVKAKFDKSNTFTYYKIDLAVKDKDNQVTRVYDLVRNYAFIITIKSASRAGSTWKEVIDENTIADNNITASAVMEKYPNITYAGETLNVTKTTFVFTGQNNVLSMTAAYKGNGQLSVVPEEDMSDVVDGNLHYPSNIPSGDREITITANIKSAPQNGERVAYFYVIGGNLQRRIKLVLRPPYNFINPRIVDGSGFNEIGEGQKKDAYLRFSIPEDVEESLYPIEYRIYTKKLYAVEKGVRLETTGNGEWYYVYTDQVPSTGERVIHFQTNTSSEAENDVTLAADLFNTANDLSYTRAVPRIITGVMKYGTQSGSFNIHQGEYVKYTYGSVSGTLTVGNNGGYSLEIPSSYSGSVNFTYEVNGITFQWSGSINAQSTLNATLTVSGWNLISGSIVYKPNKHNTSNVPVSGVITANVDTVKVIMVGEGLYALFYSDSLGGSTNFTLTYSAEDKEKQTSINKLKSNSTITLE